MAKRLNLILVGVDAPHSLFLFLKNLHVHVPHARVCGVVHVQSTGACPDPGENSSFFGKLARRVSTAGLHFVHAGTPHNGAAQTDVEELSVLCAQLDSPFLSASDLSDPAVSGSIRKHDAHLAVVFGQRHLPANCLPELPQGWLRGQIAFRNSQGHEFSNERSCTPAVAKTEIRIHHTPPGGTSSSVASVQLDARTLDSSLSMALKSELILRDLLVQSVLAFSGESDPASHLNSWIADMFPGHIIRRPQGNKGAERRFPPLRIRARWKLCLYLLLELSPFVVARNWLRRWRRNYPVAILAHHLVSDDYHFMNIPTTAAYRLLGFLKHHYAIVNLDQATKLLRSGSVPHPTLVLTFDDGYAENFLTLRALSQELDIPVTLFLSTDVITNGTEFQHDLEKGIHGFYPLTWRQIQHWSREVVEFGSHTCTHMDCGSTVPEKLHNEIVESKVELERRLAMPVHTFAFPFGRPENMSAPAKEIAAGTYDCYVSYFGGVNFPPLSGTQRHLLRADMPSNAVELELQIQEIFDYLKRAKVLVRSAKLLVRRFAGKARPAGGSNTATT